MPNTFCFIEAGTPQAAVDALIRRDIDALLERHADHLSPTELLGALSKSAIARWAAEEGSPVATARQVKEVIRPLARGHYLRF